MIDQLNASLSASFRTLACVTVAVLAAQAPTFAQSLAERVSRVADGAVQFTFAARPGVCGNGRTFISIDSHSMYGSFSGSPEGMRRDQCDPGPARVVLTRADRDIVKLETFVGRASATSGVTDLGTVPAREAADYLLTLAAKLEGKPGKDAIFPAMLADSSDTDAALLALGRDKNRPRETRRSALSWLARRGELRNPAAAEKVLATLVQIARDVNDNQSVREQAVSAMARFEGGEGVPALMDLSRNAEDPWLSKKAISALARSGDPRSRDFLKAAARRNDLPEDIRVVVIRGIGREYATSQDAEFLRGLYAGLTGEDAKESVLISLAEIGGMENTRWLLTLVRNDQEPAKLRRRALASAEKAGAPMAELLKLYDAASDPELKQALIGLYAKSGERDAIDKLIGIARVEQNGSLRRRAIASLSKSDDPRAKQVLQEIVER